MLELMLAAAIVPQNPTPPLAWELKAAQEWSGRCSVALPDRPDNRCDGALLFFQGPNRGDGKPEVEACVSFYRHPSDDQPTTRCTRMY